MFWLFEFIILNVYTKFYYKYLIQLNIFLIYGVISIHDLDK